MTLEAYLRDQAQRSQPHAVLSHALSASVTPDGVRFSIHPQGTDGPTLDFFATGNQLGAVPNRAATPDELAA